MKLLVKNNNVISVLTVVSSIPSLPEGWEILGLDSELNPNNLDIAESSLEEVEIAAEYQVLVSEEVIGQDEVFDEETGELLEAGIESQPAVYETIPAVRGMRMVMSLAKARSNKLESIRIERDIKLLENDKAFLIAFKKDEDLTAIRAEAQALRDLPAVAKAALEELESLEEINAYNAFEV